MVNSRLDQWLTSARHTQLQREQRAVVATQAQSMRAARDVTVVQQPHDSVEQPKDRASNEIGRPGS